MNGVEYFFWLVRQGTGDLFRFSSDLSWVTFLLMAIMVFASYWTFSAKKTPLKSDLFWVFSPVVITASIFAFGVFFQGDHQTMSRGDGLFPRLLVYGFLFSHVPVAIILMHRMRLYLWLILSSSTFMTWISFWASFVSHCSISGDWP
jgi:hypothetical protein